jgi:hypothetical protein
MEANAKVVSNVQACLENNRSHPVPLTAGTRVRVVDWLVDVAQGQLGLCELNDGRMVLVGGAALELDDGAVTPGVGAPAGP